MQNPWVFGLLALNRKDAVIFQAFMLSFPRPDHPFAYIGRGFGIGRRFAGEVLEPNRRDVDVDVYTIQQRAGNATHVSLNL